MNALPAPSTASGIDALQQRGFRGHELHRAEHAAGRLKAGVQPVAVLPRDDHIAARTDRDIRILRARDDRLRRGDLTVHADHAQHRLTALAALVGECERPGTGGRIGRALDLLVRPGGRRESKHHHQGHPQHTSVHGSRHAQMTRRPPVKTQILRTSVASTSCSVSVRGRDLGAPLMNAELARLAERQHGLVCLAQLRAVGLSNSALNKRVARGVLHRVYRGVHAVGHPARAREPLMLAAVFTAGEGAVLGHLAAAELRRVTRDTAPSLMSLSLANDALSPGCAFIEYALWIGGICDPRGGLQRLVQRPATRDAMERANGRHNLHVLEQAIAYHLKGSAGFRSRGEKRLYQGDRGRRASRAAREHEAQGRGGGPPLAGAQARRGRRRARPHRPRTQREDVQKTRFWQHAGYEVLRTDSLESAIRAAALVRRGGGAA